MRPSPMAGPTSAASNVATTSGQIAACPQRCETVWVSVARKNPAATEGSQARPPATRDAILIGSLGISVPTRPSANSATTVANRAEGVSVLPWAPMPATSTATGAIRAGATRGRDSVTSRRARAAAATVAPVSSTRCPSLTPPSHPACRIPTTSRATSPRATTDKASAAIRSPRPKSTLVSAKAVAVRATSTSVRPPTPSQDHATARKVLRCGEGAGPGHRGGRHRGGHLARL